MGRGAQKPTVSVRLAMLNRHGGRPTEGHPQPPAITLDDCVTDESGSQTEIHAITRADGVNHCRTSRSLCDVSGNGPEIAQDAPGHDPGGSAARKAAGAC